MRALGAGIKAARRIMQATAPAKTQVVKTLAGQRIIVPGTQPVRNQIKKAANAVRNRDPITSQQVNRRQYNTPSGTSPLHQEMRDSAERVAARTGHSPQTAYKDGVAPIVRRAASPQPGKRLGGPDKTIQNPKTDGATGGRLGSRPSGALKPSRSTGDRWANSQAAKSIGENPPKRPNLPTRTNNATAERRTNRLNHPLMIGRNGQARLRNDVSASEIQMRNRSSGTDQYGVSQYERDLRSRRR